MQSEDADHMASLCVNADATAPTYLENMIRRLSKGCNGGNGQKDQGAKPDHPSNGLWPGDQRGEVTS